MTKVKLYFIPAAQNLLHPFLVSELNSPQKGCCCHTSAHLNLANTMRMNWRITSTYNWKGNWLRNIMTWGLICQSVLVFREPQMCAEWSSCWTVCSAVGNFLHLNFRHCRESCRASSVPPSERWELTSHSWCWRHVFFSMCSDSLSHTFAPVYLKTLTPPV